MRTALLTLLMLLVLASSALAGPVSRGSLAAAKEHWGGLPCKLHLVYAPLPIESWAAATSWANCTTTFDTSGRVPWRRTPLRFCIILAHEVGHLWQGSRAEAMWHSTDPTKLMYPFFAYRRDTLECRRRWPHRP